MVSSAFVAVAQAETVFVDGKPVSQAVIDQAMAQLKKKSNGCTTIKQPSVQTRNVKFYWYATSDFS